jgi:hypothetical protein
MVEEKSTYWMGVVETQLTSIQDMLETLTDVQEKNWTEFRAWRNAVDARLAQGSVNFENHGRRLGEVETAIRKNPGLKNGDNEKFVSWPWIRDKILVPVVVWAILIVLGLALVYAVPIP